MGQIIQVPYLDISQYPVGSRQNTGYGEYSTLIPQLVNMFPYQPATTSCVAIYSSTRNIPIAFYRATQSGSGKVLRALVSNVYTGDIFLKVWDNNNGAGSGSNWTSYINPYSASDGTYYDYNIIHWDIPEEASYNDAIVYDDVASAKLALDGVPTGYPITYRLTNCTTPSAPTEAIVGYEVNVIPQFTAGYGVVNPTSDAYVTCNGVVIPSEYANGMLTFTMPDPSQ